MQFIIKTQVRESKAKGYEKMHILKISIINLIFFSYTTSIFSNLPENTKKPVILILNGFSLIDKINIRSEMEKLSNEIWTRLVTEALNICIEPYDVNLSCDLSENKKLINEYRRSQKNKLIIDLLNTVKKYAENGENVILDFNFYNLSWLKFVNIILKDYPIYLMFVRSTFEAQANNFEPNLKSIQAIQANTETNITPKPEDNSLYIKDYKINITNKPIKYDLILDLSNPKVLSPAQAADIIIKFISTNKPNALRRITSRLPSSAL